MNNTTISANETSYYISPDVLPEVYIAAACFMVCICCFGVISNVSVVILFLNSPLASGANCIHKRREKELVWAVSLTAHFTFVDSDTVQLCVDEHGCG